MTRFTVALLLVVATALVLRWRRPAWYWLTFGVTLAVLRVLVRYATVMEACGLTVPPSRWRMALARATNRPAPGPRAPRILRLRPTRTGLVVRLGLRPGQDAFDVAASCDRLRHSFGMYGVTSRELRSGVVELRMTGYDVLKRVQMPAKIDRTPMRVPVALREDGAVHYRDYRTVPHALTLGATKSGKSVYQRNLVAELAAQDVALVGIDCKQGVELFPLARRFSALADNPDTAADLLDALIARMEAVYQLIRAEQRITADVPDAEIAADIWDLPDHLRPTPVVVLVDEVAELALFTTKDEESAATASSPHWPGSPSSAAPPASTWRSAASASAPNSARASPCSAPSSPAAPPTASTTNPPRIWPSATLPLTPSLPPSKSPRTPPVSPWPVTPPADGPASAPPHHAAPGRQRLQPARRPHPGPP